MTRRVHWLGTRPHQAAQRGLTLIEVLVSVVILLVALLGAAALLARSNQSEMESYQRVQALTLLQDMVARLNANRQAVACYAIAGTMTTVGNGTNTTPTPCATGTAAQQAIAAKDLADWGTELLGSAEKSGSGSNAVALGAMIGARGCIEVLDSVNQIYRISVAWQGLTQTVSPSLPCGSGASFGNDTYRRAISVQVRIGALTS